MLRTAISNTSRTAFTARAHAFHTTPVTAKTVTEKVTEVADKVNKSVGRGLASAIDKGEQVTEATKETIGLKAQEAKHASKTAAHKVNQTAAGARQGSHDFKEDVKKEAGK